MTVDPDSEEWRDVPGYEGLYQVSSLGRVKRLPRWVNAHSGGTRRLPESITFGHMGGRGYLRAKLTGDGRARNVDIHPLVCRAFHGTKPTEKHHAAHRSGIKTNNRKDNLRWATPKENSADRIKHGGQVRGEHVSTGKLTASQVLDIRGRYVRRYGIIKELAAEFEVRSESIIAIVKRRAWAHI